MIGYYNKCFQKIKRELTDEQQERLKMAIKSVDELTEMYEPKKLVISYSKETQTEPEYFEVRCSKCDTALSDDYKNYYCCPYCGQVIDKSYFDE